MSSDQIPPGLYLRTRYEDPLLGEVREREYADSGEVWLVVNGHRSLWAALDDQQVASAKAAVESSGLTDQDDVPPLEDAHDLATMTYDWRLGERLGRVVDAAYQAVVPVALDRLEEMLANLEEGSTHGPA